jgi:hypothetical protein
LLVKQNGVTQVSSYSQLRVSCYTVTASLSIVLPPDVVQVGNMRTYKRKTKRGTTFNETCMVTTKEFMGKALNLRKSSAKLSVNVVRLQ